MDSRVPVLELLQPPDGGVAEHVLRLALGLRARGWTVEVATGPDSVLRAPLDEQGVPVHVLPFVREPGRRDLAAIRALRALDARRRFGIVHAHSSKAGALARAALPCHRRLVYTPHTLALAHDFGPARRALYWGVEQALVPRTAAMVAVSAWERSEAQRQLRGMSGRVHLIRHGVPAAAPSEPDAELMSFAGGRPLAGLVSVLRREKDPLALVHAAERLVRRHRLPGRVAIVGEGAVREQVRAEIAVRGLEAQVRWFPYGGRMEPYLAALDLYVLPSLWESMPIAVLEAMSHGLAVLASDVGGMPEAVEDGVTGRLVPARDVGVLAAALEQLLGDRRALRAMGERGRVVARDRFGLDRMVAETAALYGGVLVGSRGAAVDGAGTRRRRIVVSMRRSSGKLTRSNTRKPSA